MLEHSHATGLSATTSSDEGNHSLVRVVDLETDIVKGDNVLLLGVGESHIFQGEVASDIVVVLNTVTIGVDDCRHGISNFGQGGVNTLHSKDVSNDERQHPELEDKSLSEENVLGYLPDSDLVILIEAVRNVADDSQCAVHSNLLDEGEAGCPDGLLDTSVKHQNISRFKLFDFCFFSGEGLHRLDVSETLESVRSHSGLFLGDELLELFHAFAVATHSTDAEE